MYCVYKHQNLINGKVYIGVTNDIARRWRQNGIEYKSCKSFYNAILKYGFDSFDHTVLETNLSEKQAFEREIYYIKLFRSDDKRKGYNISPGGNGGKVYKNHPRNMLGKSQTGYQKDNQSRLMKETSFNPMKNGGCVWGITHDHPKGMSGKHHTKEHNERISNKMRELRVNCKPLKIVYPDGREEIYNSTGEAQKIGLTKPILLKIIRSGKPYEIRVINQYTEKIKHLAGIRIEYLDNTEITGEIKESPVS